MQPTPPEANRQSWGRSAFIVAGYGFLAIGIVGAFVPLLPTTVFWLLAIVCFMRSSPRLARRILKDRHAGPAVKNWLRYGIIGRRAKIAACTGMAIGFVLAGFAFAWAPLPVIATAAVLIACALYVTTRPATPPAAPSDPA